MTALAALIAPSTDLGEITDSSSGRSPYAANGRQARSNLDRHKFADAARLSFVHSLLPTKTDSFRPILNAQAAKEPTKNSCKEALRAAAIRLYEEDNTNLDFGKARMAAAETLHLLKTSSTAAGLEDSQWRRIEDEVVSCTPKHWKGKADKLRFLRKAVASPSNA